MPIYEYACQQCGHQFEKLQRVGAAAPECPQCDATEVRKRVSASGFILKGGGWYKDHYGLKKGGSASGDSAGGSGESGGKSDSAGSTPAAPSSAGSTPAGPVSSSGSGATKSAPATA